MTACIEFTMGQQSTTELPTASRETLCNTFMQTTRAIFGWLQMEESTCFATLLSSPIACAKDPQPYGLTRFLPYGMILSGSGPMGAVVILKGVKHSSLTGNELSGFPVESLFQDSHGVIWLGVGGKLMAYEHGRLQRIKDISKGVITAISEDTNHNVLALTLRGGLFRVEDGTVHELLPAKKDLPRTGFLAPDREGGVWIGGRTNDLRYYRDGRVDTILIKGLDSSASVFGLMIDNDNSLWVPTSNGMFRWSNNNWQVLNKRNGLPCDVIFSAIRGDDGVFWLYSQCGLMKVARSEVDRWRERSDSKLTVEVFDKFDGATRVVANLSQPVTAKTFGWEALVPQQAYRAND